MVSVRSERTAAIVGTGPLARAIDAGCRRAGYRVSLHDPLHGRLRIGALRRVGLIVVVGTYSDVEPAMGLPLAERVARQRAVLARAIAQARRGCHLVYVTSASVAGTRPDGGVIQDGDPLTRDPGHGLVAELLAIREPLDQALDPLLGTARGGRHLPIAELRLAALVGPGVDTVMTRHFEAPRLLQVLGGDMRWQFIHSADAAEAVVHIAVHQLDGVYTAGAEGTLSMERVCELTGMRTLTLARSAAFEAADKLHSVGMIGSPVSDLSVVVDPWPVSSRGLRESGWRPRHTNEQCLAAIIEEYRNPASPRRRSGSVGLRAGALSAGAAIAAFSTAALVRRSRRR